MAIPSLNKLSAIQCSQVGKRNRKASIINVCCLCNQSNLYCGTHHLNLFNQTDSSWGFREYQRFVVHMDLRRFYHTRPTMGMRLRVSDASAVESSKKLWHGTDSGRVLQGSWNFHSQWHSFQPQTEKRKLTLTITHKITP